jgi:putative spermidine/putrescine transport system permease protein
LNWGLASALGAFLLVGVLAVYILYDRLVGIDTMKLG